MKRQHAFTMLETLVLIGSSTILGAVLVASLGDAQEKTRTAVCVNNLREIGMAISMYANDHNDYYPPGYVSSVGDWSYFISPYLGKFPIAYGPDRSKRSRALLCPSGIQSTNNLSIGLMYSAHTRLLSDGSTPSLPLYRRGYVSRSAEIILVADGFQQDVLYVGSFDAAANFSSIAVSKLAYNPATADQVLSMNSLSRSNLDCLGCASVVGLIRFRHSGNTAANFLFCDMHVETLAYGQIKARNFMYDPTP